MLLGSIAGAGPAIADLADEDHGDEEDQGCDVGQRDEPVARMGDDERRAHPFAADSNQRPRHVKQTISTSMTICERVASFGSS